MNCLVSSESFQLDQACVEHSRNGMLLPPSDENFIYASKSLMELFQKEKKSKDFNVFFVVSQQGLSCVSRQDTQIGQLSFDKLLIREFRNLVPPLELDLLVQLLGF